MGYSGLWLGFAIVLGQEVPTMPLQADLAAEAHVQHVLKTLPERATLRDVIEDGQRGDGVRRPWMDAMQREGVRAGLFVVKFKWDDGPKQLSIGRERYLSSYRFEADEVFEARPAPSEVRTTSKLRQELRNAALKKVKELLPQGLDKFGMRRAEGIFFIALLDDPWLPTPMSVPPMTDPDQTDLMRVVGSCDVPLAWHSGRKGARDPYRREVFHARPLPEEIQEANRHAEAEVARLLAAGAKVNAKDQDGETALLIAAANCAYSTVRLLLDAGADVNAKTREGQTALMWAVRKRKVDTVELLLARGADVNAKADVQETALRAAVANDDEALSKRLLAAGANPNAPEKDGGTLLMFAAAKHATMVSILLRAGADANTRNRSGETPLMWAAYVGDPKAVKALIAAGADLAARNNHGETALWIAEKRNFAEIVQLLKRADANE